jgi:glycosyltransferase involved in cell wall biosynthesis
MFPHYPEERTKVVYPASRFSTSQRIARPRDCSRLSADRFFLSVCTLEPRKNLARLLEAYAEYAAQTPEPMPLVLAGGRGWLMEGFEQQIRTLNLGGRLIRMGYVDDRTLQWLYQNCHSFLYPSLFEGFGLPVVEALSQGAAVLTSRCTSLPEVAGDAAVYVDPTNSAGIADGLCRLAVDESARAQLRNRARDQAAKFSWHAAAQQTIECYHRALGMQKYAGR